MQSWDDAVRDLPAPLAIVDLDALEANARAMHARAKDKPIRVVSKSVRCRDILQRVLEMDGYQGVMCFSLAEALWLHSHGIRDLFVAYPTADTAALRALADDPAALREISLAVDSPDGVDLISATVPGVPVRVVVDIDCAYRVGRLRLGVWRSSVRSEEGALDLTRHALRSGLRVVGALFYDAQVAGLSDARAAVRAMKRRSVVDIVARAGAIVRAMGDLTDLEIVNAGGTGSLHLLADDPHFTELAAGSGLYNPTLFDDYTSFTHRPAAAFALPVVRRPAPHVATLFGGGYIASGPPGASRVPTPVHPAGLRLSRNEGAGEVQTPVVGRAASSLRLGDRVWFRHAKAGELAERFATLQLISQGRLVGAVPTYRGEGKCFG